MKQVTPKVRSLTRKQAAFVKHIVDNPKASTTQSALAVYGKPGEEISEGTAQQIAFDNLRKPNIVTALNRHIELVENAVVKTVEDWKDENNSRKREIAMQNAQWIHDKVFGRSKQQIEMSTTSVSINIDLTGAADDNTDTSNDLT